MKLAGYTEATRRAVGGQYVWVTVCVSNCVHCFDFVMVSHTSFDNLR